jgi:hypothetical protein
LEPTLDTLEFYVDVATRRKLQYLDESNMHVHEEIIQGM